MDRAGILRQAGTLIRERREMIARIMTIEQGKPRNKSRLKVTSSAEILEWCAEEARRIYGCVVPSRWRTVRQLVLRDPIGPVAAFTAWNFPAILPARKLECSLAAGCSRPDHGASS